MSNIFKPRISYGPFEYPKAYDFWTKQQAAHWTHLEVQMSSDLNDWKMYMSDVDKAILGNTLKGFVAVELFVEDYWTTKVSRWFKKSPIFIGVFWK